MVEVVVVGVDGSEAGTRAAHFAACHVGEGGADVVVAYVIPWSPYAMQSAQENDERPAAKRQELAAAREHVVDPLVAELTAAGASVEAMVRHGHPAETLCDIARERNASHVVVGRRGQSKVRSLLFGSTPGTLIQIATVPVTVVP